MVKPKRGRPPMAKAERRRNIVSVRLRDETLKMLTNAARESGRSISQEAEIRIESDFQKGEIEQSMLELSPVILGGFLDALQVVTSASTEAERRRQLGALRKKFSLGDEE